MFRISARAPRIGLQKIDGRSHRGGRRLCFHNEPRPTDRLKTVPQPSAQATLAPPPAVVP